MSRKEARKWKIFIFIATVLFGVCFYFAMETRVSSWKLTVVCIIFGIITLSLTRFFYFLNYLGCFATELNLDDDLVYKIKEVVNLKDGTTLFILEGSMDYETQVVEGMINGFKKFDVIEDKYLVPKKFKAKLVDGHLLMPVR